MIVMSDEFGASGRLSPDNRAGIAGARLFNLFRGAFGVWLFSCFTGVTAVTTTLIGLASGSLALNIISFILILSFVTVITLTTYAWSWGTSSIYANRISIILAKYRAMDRNLRAPFSDLVENIKRHPASNGVGIRIDKFYEMYDVIFCDDKVDTLSDIAAANEFIRSYKEISRR